MHFNKCALLCAILALSILEPITAKRSFSRGGGSHSYPKSGGLSGGGHSGGHGYPSSGGLSGGGSHGYPSSGGLSGGGHGYPSSGGNPSSGNHGYPSSGGNHGYPSSGGGLSGSGNTHHTNNHGYPAGKGLAGNTGTTTVHHHYHYSPPQQISYAPMHGGPARSYPVYHGTPPTYVYQYKDSGSKYGTLLTGLALLNLGALAGTAYAVTHSHSNNNNNNYKSQPGEVCKFGLKKDNGDYEETRIDCQLITSFIFQEEANKAHNGTNNTVTTTTTVTNVTMVNTTNAVPDPAAPPLNNTILVGNITYEMLPNGTLVPLNSTHSINDASSTNNATSSVMVTTTTTNTTTVTNALDVKGNDVKVTPGMQCFVLRVTPSSKMRKSVPCGLLQTYAEKSIQKSSGVRNVPAFTVLAVMVAAFVMY